MPHGTWQCGVGVVTVVGSVGSVANKELTVRKTIAAVNATASGRKIDFCMLIFPKSDSYVSLGKLKLSYRATCIKIAVLTCRVNQF